jgi:crossover junction endodeoxyribonuclease RuvC
MSKANEVIRNEEECTIEKNCTTDPKFVGLDLSYSGTGLIVLDNIGEILEQKLISTDSKDDTEDRLIQIENEIKFIPNIVGLKVVFVEGPSYSSRGDQMLQMGALNIFIRIFFRKNKVNYRVIAPPTLKKWVAKTGRAKKEMMLLHIYKRWGIEFENNNLADAYGLARMAQSTMEEEK